MNIKFEAIKEAITFIKNNWIGNQLPYWEGEPHEFVGATLFGGVTTVDLTDIVKAISNGEPVDIEDLTGEIINKKLTKVRVLK